MNLLSSLDPSLLEHVLKSNVIPQGVTLVSCGDTVSNHCYCCCFCT